MSIALGGLIKQSIKSDESEADNCVSIKYLSALLSPTQPYCLVRINSKHLP